MRGKKRLLQGVKALGKQVKSKRNALLGALKSGSSTLTQKSSGLKTSLRKMVKGIHRITG